MIPGARRHRRRFADVIPASVSILRRLAVALVLVAAGCSAPVLRATDIAAVAERAAAAVWRVDATGCGWRSTGSAFAIGDRHLVTNRHVVAVDSSPDIRSRDGHVRNGRVIGSAEHPDLAVIEVSDDLPVKLPLASTESLGPREPLVVLGYPAPAHAFKVSAGRIVNFQGTDRAPREAALTNVPISLGNSGGPGLRSDASVAGVVTRMRLRSDSKDKVAIMFTADAVRTVIDRFIAQPRKVLSTCGLGPDYVPPVPKTYEIEKAPATAPPVAELPAAKATPKPRVPTIAPVQTLPAARPTTGPPAPDDPTPSPVPCPTGTVTTRVEEVAATEKQDEPGSWLVRVRGTVKNETTSDVRVSAVYVHVDGDPPANVAASARTPVLSENGSSPWDAPEVEVRSEERPMEATAFARWDWNDPYLAHCATD